MVDPRVDLQKRSRVRAVGMSLSTSLIFTLFLLFSLVFFLRIASANGVNPYLESRHRETMDLFPLIFILNFPINTVLYISLLRWVSSRSYGTNVFTQPPEVFFMKLIIHNLYII